MSNPLPIADILANLPTDDVTEQMIVEAVALHLWKQNERSVGVSSEGVPRCLYRTGTDLMCAVGVLIPSGLYAAKIEELPIIDIASDFGFPAYFTKHAELLSALQHFHDVRYDKDMSVRRFTDCLKDTLNGFSGIDYSFLAALPLRRSPP